MKNNWKRNFYRTSFHNVSVYMLVTAFACAAALLLAVMTNMHTSRVAVLITVTMLVLGICVQASVIAEQRILVKMQQHEAWKAYRFLLNGDFKRQVTQIVSDWRDRGSAFPNQIKLLYAQLETLTGLARAENWSPRSLMRDIADLCRKVEQEKFGNVIWSPATLEVFIDEFSRIRVTVAGKDIYEPA